MKVDILKSWVCVTQLCEEDINNMPYLHAVVKESMRLSSPLMLTVPHSTTKEIYLDDHHFTVNTQIVCHLGALGHHPELYDNPEEFIPTRHLETMSCSPHMLSPRKGTKEPNRVIAFQAWQKLCPGKGLDMLHICILLVKILQTFDLSPLYGDIYPFSLKETVEWGVINVLKEPLVACLKPHL